MDNVGAEVTYKLDSLILPDGLIGNWKNMKSERDVSELKSLTTYLKEFDYED